MRPVLATSPPRFSPRRVRDCVLFLDARSIAAGAVASAPNLGTLGGNFVQATGASQPTNTAGAGPNGGAALVFDGGDWLASDLAASAWTPLHAASCAIYVVWKTTSANPNAYFGIVSTAAAGSTNRGVSVFYDDRSGLSRNDAIFGGVNSGTAWVAQSLSANNAMPAATWSLLEIVFEQGVSGDDLRIYRNGALATSADSTAAVSASAPQGTLEIGRLVSDAGSRLIGSIAEIAIYSPAPSAAARDYVRRGLGAKNGLTV